MATRYKDKALNKVYAHLLGKTPQEVRQNVLHGVFRQGFEGRGRPHYVSVGTPAYAAYYAGKETRRRMRRGRLIR